MAERLNDVLDEVMQEYTATPAEETAEPIAEPTEEAGDVPRQGAETPAEVPAEVAETPAEVPQEIPQAEAPADMQNQIAQLQATVQQLLQAQQQAQNLVKEQNEANEETVVSTLAEPPKMDFNALVYMSDEDRAQASAKYMAEMAEYTKRGIMDELKPVMDEYQQRMANAEKEKVIAAYGSDPSLVGFSDNLKGIENVLAKTPELANAPQDKRYLIGYLMQRGLNDMNRPEMTVDELVDKVWGNPDAMKAIEKKRAIEQAQINQSVPPITASQGQANAPAFVPEEPRTLAEAYEQSMKALRK